MTRRKTIVLVDGETFAEVLLTRWEDLPETARDLLGVKPKEASIRERFVVDEPPVRTAASLSPIAERAHAT